MRRAPLPPRTSPMPRGKGLARASFTVYPGGRDGSNVIEFPARKQRKRTGFPETVKLAVRKRAGGGDPDNARCEATGVWLGRYGGEIQHRDARGMGGTSLPVTNSIVNAVLLSTEAHRLAESRDPLLNAQGFWLRNGEDPAETPIMLHSQYGSGVTVWLTPAGGYSPLPPFGGAA